MISADAITLEERYELDLKDRLHNHLVEIVRERDPYLASAGHFYVQQYICEQFGQWGTVETHSFEVRGKSHQNLILNLSSPQRIPPIIIGAHYDAVPGTPGADDNATGVAALLEIARTFATEPLHHPIRLIAFDMEEYGMLGSAAYAAELKQQKQQVRLMFSLEMLGYCDRTPHSQHYPAGLKYFYPHQGNFIALVGNLATIPDLFRLSRSIRKQGTLCEWLPVPNGGKLIPQTRLSDHSPFWDQGYRAIMVTDTSFMRNPYYHKASDTIQTLDLDFLGGVCRGAIAGIRNLMNK